MKIIPSILSKSGAAAMLCLSLLAVSASASPIQVNYSATLTGALGTLSAGTVLSGNIVLDDAVSPYVVDAYGSHYSNNAILSVTVGGETILTPYGYAQIGDNTAPYAPYDLVSLTTNYPSTGSAFSLGGLSGVAVGFLFFGNSSLITDESLYSAAHLDLSNATAQANMYFYQGGSGSNQGYFVGGPATITSWEVASVPDTGLTVAMLGSAMLGLVTLRRKLVAAA